MFALQAAYTDVVRCCSVTSFVQTFFKQRVLITNILIRLRVSAYAYAVVKNSLSKKYNSLGSVCIVQKVKY